MDNPFIKAGGPVSGERLVGRSQVIKRLERDLRYGANCSVSGLRRIGKSSLGRQICTNIQTSSSNIRCVEIGMDTVESESEFYFNLAKKLWNDDFSAYNVPGKEHDFYFKIVNKLEENHRNDNNLLIMLDELDHIRTIPRSDILVNRIREIANNPRCGITFLFISARSLKCLEDNTGNVSNLHGICHNICLRPLAKDEGLKQMLRRADVDDEKMLEILYQTTGGHPFLAETLLYYAIDLAEAEQTKLCADHLSKVITTNDCASAFMTYYEALEEFISSWDKHRENQTSGKAFDALLDIVVGPKLGEPDARLFNFFKSYGLIREDGLCMSEHLKSYLSYKRRQKPFEPLFNDLERSLRELVKHVFTQKKGYDWVNELSKDEFYKKIFGELAQLMEREQKRWQLGCSSDILKYSYPSTLKDIICHNWPWFQRFVGDSKKDFCDWMDSISRIRNAVKHNRPPELISPEEYAKAKRACEKLLGHLANKNIADQ